MPFKIYEPIKTSEIKAIRWFGDNWSEVEQFLGNKKISENFLFTLPLTKKKKEILTDYHLKNLCDSKGRQNIIFKTGYTKDSADCLYYGD